MKSKMEILERKFVYEIELEKHKQNPHKYDKNFTELIEHQIGLLEWILK